MDSMTPERLAELKAVAEAGNGSSDDQSIGYDDFGDLAVGKGMVLALIDALEAKNAEVNAKADYVSDLEERVRQRDNHVIPVLHARIKEAERERDEARAMYDRDMRNAKAARDQIAEMERDEKARADRAEAALERVKALHKKRDDGWCAACSEFHDDGTPQDWPCATIEAIEGAGDA